MRKMIFSKEIKQTGKRLEKDENGMIVVEATISFTIF